jgi:hypothetical protein
MHQPGRDCLISFVAAMNDDQCQRSPIGGEIGVKLKSISSSVNCNHRLGPGNRNEGVPVASPIAGHPNELKQSLPSAGGVQCPDRRDNILSNFASPT